MEKINEKTCNNYQRTQMQRELVFQKLKEKGYRITNQRKIILDIILENDCSCCKEIYYKASLEDKRIGIATVYRMVSVLEEVGAISRKIINQNLCNHSCQNEKVCVVQFDNNTILELSKKEWEQIMHKGLCACGYIESCSIQNIVMNVS